LNWVYVYSLNQGTRFFLDLKRSDVDYIRHLKSGSTQLMTFLISKLFSVAIISFQKTYAYWQSAACSALFQLLGKNFKGKETVDCLVDSRVG